VTYAHIDDLAELYAMGALGDDERTYVEAHLRACTECAQAIGLAERDVALIASMEPQQSAPAALAGRIERLLGPDTVRLPQARRGFGWGVPALAAAALLVGLLPSFYFWSENETMHGAMIAQSAAIDRLASAPHRTAAFSSASSTTASTAAEVMYGVDGSWYVVVVRNASKPLGVAWMHDGTRTMLGTTVPHGNVAMLYLPQSHRMDRLALMDGDRVVAEATLTWESTSSDRPGARSG
jgi:anti-sigma factor RsiW